MRSQYRREDLTIAAERMFYSPEYRFNDVVKVMSKMGVIDDRKFSVCLASNMYLENRQYFGLTDDELRKVFPFNYLIVPSAHFQYEFTQRIFRVMVEGVMPMV